MIRAARIGVRLRLNDAASSSPLPQDPHKGEGVLGTTVEVT
jgi:hypothetical protein